MICASKINVFMYFDYTEYIRDLLNSLKADGGNSLRRIQAELGVKGSGFFTRILDKSRPISPENAQKLSISLNMTKEEAKYFLCLVKFNNERNVDKREQLLKNLLSMREISKESSLVDSSLHFFDKWYIPVIRDLLPILPEGRNTPNLAQKVGRMVVPPLKASQVQNAIDYLEQNNFVSELPDGKFSVSEQIISTPPRVRSTILRKYHIKNLEVNQNVYDELSGDDRSVSSVTCSLSKESFEKIRQEIQAFREKILAIAREDQNPDRVCHVGFQLVPRAIVPTTNTNAGKPK